MQAARIINRASRITSLVLLNILLRSVRTADGTRGAIGGTAMHPFLQETALQSPDFNGITTEDLRFDHSMAENKPVRMHLYRAIPAIALSCALAPTLAGFAYQ